MVPSSACAGPEKPLRAASVFHRHTRRCTAVIRHRVHGGGPATQDLRANVQRAPGEASEKSLEAGQVAPQFLLTPLWSWILSPTQASNPAAWRESEDSLTERRHLAVRVSAKPSRSQGLLGAQAHRK